jgi:hypothetical protein
LARPTSWLSWICSPPPRTHRAGSIQEDQSRFGPEARQVHSNGLNRILINGGPGYLFEPAPIYIRPRTIRGNVVKSF